MRNLSKRSLVTAFLLTTVSSGLFAADFVAEAFTNGKGKRRIKVL